METIEIKCRCKDCIFSKKHAYKKVSLVCTRFKTGEYTHLVHPNDFCSKAEPKTGCDLNV